MGRNFNELVIAHIFDISDLAALQGKTAGMEESSENGSSHLWRLASYCSIPN